MQTKKLKNLKEHFYELYPNGFEDEKLQLMRKRHNVEKLSLEAKEMFKKDNFAISEQICEGYAKIISKSSMISFYEKPKVKEMVKQMDFGKKDMFCIGLDELLFSNKEDGFESLVEILSYYKLAKWSLISAILYYVYPKKEYFIKPTTTKNILAYFEITEPVYKPKPSFKFYVKYKKILNDMKKAIDFQDMDNAAFTGFLMISLKDFTKC